MSSSHTKKLSLFLLVMINIAIILSIKNWAFTAEYGLASITFVLLSLLTFFIPLAFITAELASSIPELGGPYAWVKYAFGKRAGFLAIWFLWLQNVVWYPSILSFIVTTCTYAINPELALSPFFNGIAVIILFWLVTFLTLSGIETTTRVSSICIIIGTLIPGAMIIFLAFLWLLKGHPTAIALELKGLIPTNFSWSHLAFLAGVISSFAGIEISAIHAKDVENPRKSYPIAILISSLIIAFFSIFGILAIALVIPHDRLNLVSGFIETMSIFLNQFGLSYLVPLFGIMIAVGALGSMASWTAGPSRALLASALDGDLPEIFAKTNRFKMPYILLIVQGLIVTFLSSLFFWIPSIGNIFWIFVAITAELYFIFYFFIIFTFLKLRKENPDLPRHYLVPGGKVGAWICIIITIFSLSIGFIMGLIPPTSFTGNNSHYMMITFLILGLSIITPLYITRHLKKGKS